MAKLTAAAATLLIHLLPSCDAFTLYTSTNNRLKDKIASTELYNNNKATLRDALSTLSGKLTTSPEIVLPEPSDPTAILLQASAIQKLSKSVRDAKANTVWIDGSVSNLATLCNEQEEARGNFPGPLTVIYCPTSMPELSEATIQAADIASAGAIGMLLPLTTSAITSLDDISEGGDAEQYYKIYTEAGLEPIPEVLLDESFAVECNVEELVDIIAKQFCGGEEPAAVLVTVNTEVPLPSAKAADDESSDNEIDLPLPSVPRALKKRVPILGSMKCAAQQVSKCAGKHKDAGFTGSVLRAECVPGGGRMNPDLKFVGDFWTYIVSDLKSVRSKSFGFRSKTDNLNVGDNVPGEWAKYQEDVISSGALGSKTIEQDPSFKSDDGTYRGF